MQLSNELLLEHKAKLGPLCCSKKIIFPCRCGLSLQRSFPFMLKFCKADARLLQKRHSDGKQTLPKNIFYSRVIKRS